MRYDDRITAIESPDRVLTEQTEAETLTVEQWAADVARVATEIYNPEPEYLDQDWIDKNNY
jgi:hypothetical protein